MWNISEKTYIKIKYIILENAKKLNNDHYQKISDQDIELQFDKTAIGRGKIITCHSNSLDNVKHSIDLSWPWVLYPDSRYLWYKDGTCVLEAKGDLEVESFEKNLFIMMGCVDRIIFQKVWSFSAFC
jgi:hypothetical protein